MGALAPEGFDAFLGVGRHGFAFEVIINVGIGDAEGFFVRKQRAIILKVRGRDFCPRGFRCTEVLKKLGALALVEAG